LWLGSLAGFYETSRGELRVFGRGGDTLYFHTELALVPEHKLGFFVSYNSDTGAAARNQIVEAFFKRYFPRPAPAAPDRSEAARRRLARFAGAYRSTRYDHTTLAKMSALIGTIRVTARADGTLSVPILGVGRKPWVEVGPLLFQERDGVDKIAFREDDRGLITHLFLGPFPPLAFERLTAGEDPRVHLTLAVSSLLVLASAAATWPIGYARRRWKKLPPASPERGARAARVLAWSVSVLFILFLVLSSVAQDDPLEIVFGVPPLLARALVLPVLAALLSPAVVVFVVLAWKRGYWRIGARLHYTLVALAAGVFLWVLNYWNLLGFKY
jgi:hypothetical protein